MKTDSRKVDYSDLMAIVTFVKVKSIPSGDRLTVEDVDGHNGKFDVIGKNLIEEMYSADRFLKTVEVTRTNMAEILSASYNRPFTVTYKKQNGELRNLRGRLIKPEPLMGRVQVEDLDKEEGDRFRLVDNRTLEALIVGGVKYILKEK